MLSCSSACLRTGVLCDSVLFARRQHGFRHAACAISDVVDAWLNKYTVNLVPLITWNGVHGRLIISQLVNKVLAVYAIRSIFTIFTTAPFLNQMNPGHVHKPNFFSMQFGTLPLPPPKSCTSGLFASVLPITTLRATSVCPHKRITYPVHLVLHDLGRPNYVLSR